MYTVFVGHPGIGKGRAINPAIHLLREANTTNLMSDKLTIQYILERLAVGFTSAHATPTGMTFGVDSSCMISAPEMEVFLTTSDALPSLAELWECKDGPSDYGTRGKGLVQISKPCPTLIGGMTLRQACDYMSTKVVSGGFTRRVNFVYAADKDSSKPFPAWNGSVDKTITELITDMRHISTLRGEVKLDKPAMALYKAYYHMADKVNEFDDEATVAYATSKWVHVLKLSTAICCSKRDSMLISQDDITEAVTAVEQCANDLQRVFRSVGDSNMAGGADRILKFLEIRGYATRNDIMNAMWRHMSSPELDVLLATLESGNMIVPQERAGKTVFRAVPQGSRQQSGKAAGGP